MAQLSLTCLGNFQVMLAGEQLTAFQTDKMRALLVYLVMEDQVHQRSALSQFLWPGYSQESANNSLRQSLHHLRQLFHDAETDPPWLLITRLTVQFNPAAPIRVDVATFTKLIEESTVHPHPQLATCQPCLTRLRQAVDLYHGDFLAGFTVADSDPFEEWRRSTQEQLHLQLLATLTQLADAAEATGDDESALQNARRQLALEPWLEAAHRRIMRILARGGQRAAAIAQYQRCRQVLVEELGAAPEQETTTLYEQIQSGNFDKTTKRQGDGAPLTEVGVTNLSLSQIYSWGEMPAVDFFTGREAELAQLTAWLTPEPGADAPLAQLISVLGLGGVGKTTLAAAVTKEVAPSFAVVIWRSLLNAPPLPTLLRDWLQILVRQTLASIPETLDEQMRLLLDYLRQTRCLLVLDNVESVFQANGANGRAGATRPGYEDYDQLFQQLSSSDHRSCLLLTSREQPYALMRLGRQAQVTGRVRLLALTGLDLQAGHALLQSNGLHTSPQAAAELVKNYSGNPLALQIAAATIVDFFGGDFAAFQREEGAFFDGMREVLDQQFARLSTLERDLLVWLAIEREASTVQMLRSNLVQPVTTSEFLEALHALHRRSLLEKVGDSLTLQNVIIEYTTEYLVEQVCREIEDDFRSEIDNLQKSLPNEDFVNSQLKVVNLFMNRFALLKAEAKEYVRQSQMRLIVQPIAERLAAKLSQAQLLAYIPRRLDALRTVARQPGYAAGNLLNLLIYWRVNLTGYDFSNLTVWQADLRGVMLTDLNFTGADLAHSAFTQRISTGAVKIAPTGEVMIAGVNDRDLWLWHAVEGQLMAALRSPSNGGEPIIFSPDGALIAAAGLDRVIRIWSAANGVCLQTLHGHTSTIYALALNADNTLLASGAADDRFVYLWDVRTGQLLQQLAGHEHGIEALAFSPDGAILASGSSDHTIRLWDILSVTSQGQLINTLYGHTREVGALAFSVDGTQLASGDHGGALRVWDLNAQETCLSLPNAHTSIMRVLRFQPGGQLLASGNADQTVRLWSLSGQLLYTLAGHIHEVRSLDFSADGRLLASGGADQKVYLWNTHTGQALNSLQAYQHGVNSVRFSPDGQVLASGGTERLVRLWQAPAQGAPPAVDADLLIRSLQSEAHFVCALAFHPQGHILVSGSADQSVRLWSLATGQIVHTLQGHTNAVLSVVFSPDGVLLASASVDHTIRLWSVAENLRLQSHHHRLLLGHQAEVTTVVFSPDGRTLVSSSLDGTARIWDVASGATLHILTGHTTTVSCIAISPDGGTIATISFDHILRLWSAATGQCCVVQKTASMGVRVVAFSPDGEWLAYGGIDFAIYLWRWRTDESPFALLGHTDVVRAVDFSPTSPLLVSGSVDGTVRLWDLATRTCCQTLRAPGPYAGMNITGVIGISTAQKATLKALGAVDGE